MSETGDRVTKDIFLANVFALITEVNVVRVREEKGRLIASLKPTLLKRTTPIPNDIVAAFERVTNVQVPQGGTSVASSSGYAGVTIEKEIGGGGQAKVFKYATHHSRHLSFPL